MPAEAIEVAAEAAAALRANIATLAKPPSPIRRLPRVERRSKLA